jgi:hypothetical protein
VRVQLALRPHLLHLDLEQQHLGRLLLQPHHRDHLRRRVAPTPGISRLQD